MAIIQTPSIANVVEDQTPQLGGSLSTNGSNINVESGDVLYVHNLGTEGDANYERLEVKWDANVAVVSTATSGTGSNASLIVGGPNYAAASNLFFNASNGTGSLRYGSAEVVSWASTTVTVSRNLYPSSDSLRTNGIDTRRWLNTYTDTITIGNGVDAVLTADADNELALRNSTTAQQFNVYNTYTDASNYERLEVKWEANVAKIQTATAGTGSNDTLELVGSNSLLFIGPTLASFVNASLTMTQSDTLTETYNDFVPATDGTYDNGAPSARWATTYTGGFATNVETFTAASDTLDEKNNVCLCDCSSNAITLALPAPVSGLQFHIKKTDATANTVSVEPDDPGPELIDGAVSSIISTQYDSITVVSDGSNWFII